MKVNGKLNGIITWNGWYYGFKQLKRGKKCYRSKNSRFDDTCGGTEECTAEEYDRVAEKYYKIFGKD